MGTKLAPGQNKTMWISCSPAEGLQPQCVRENTLRTLRNILTRSRTLLAAGLLVQPVERVQTQSLMAEGHTPLGEHWLCQPTA